jgi:hypothetical protein
MLSAMDNNPDVANPHDDGNWPTEQLWTGSGPAGPSGPAKRPSRHVLRWAGGIAAAAVLIGGGTALAASSSGSPGASSATVTDLAAGSQAAALSTVLNSASAPNAADLLAASPGAITPPAPGLPGHPCARAARILRAARHPGVARIARIRCAGRLGRLRLLIRGLHGQVTFQTKKGPVTLGFVRGKVTAVTSSSVTVQAADGTTQTWHMVSDSVVREGGHKVSWSSLADGQQVFAGGPVVSGADDARLVVIRPPAAQGSTLVPAPSSAPAA